MRAAMGILVVVIIMTAVLLSAKKQADALKPPAGASSPTGATGAPKNLPQAVGQQVQDAIDQGAQRASDSQP